MPFVLWSPGLISTLAKSRMGCPMSRRIKHIIGPYSWMSRVFFPWNTQFWAPDSRSASWDAHEKPKGVPYQWPSHDAPRGASSIDSPFRRRDTIEHTITTGSANIISCPETQLHVSLRQPTCTVSRSLGL